MFVPAKQKLNPLAICIGVVHASQAVQVRLCLHRIFPHS